MRKITYTLFYISVLLALLLFGVAGKKIHARENKNAARGQVVASQAGKPRLSSKIVWRIKLARLNKFNRRLLALGKRLKKISERIAKRVDRFRQNGADVSLFEDKIYKLSADIDSLDKALSELESLKEDIVSDSKIGKEEYQNYKTKVKEVRKIFLRLLKLEREIVKDMMSLKKTEATVGKNSSSQNK